MQALADRLDPKISAQAISKYEAEKMLPSSRVLVGLGRELGVSLDILMGGQVETLECVEWRKHSRSSAQDRAKAEAVVIERLEPYLAIEDILALEPEADPFGSVRIAEVEDEAAVDGLAQAVRNEWKLGIDPIPSITSILEDKGLRVVEADLPERINGLACRVERTSCPPTEVIVVSKRTNVERKRLNLVHELAHRIISATGDPARRQEQAMNRFAGAFLVPREHLVARAGRNRNRMTWHEIMELKRTYGVSAAAMLLRLGRGRRPVGGCCRVCIQDLRAKLAEGRTGANRRRGRVFDIRETATLRTARLARSRGRADLACAGGANAAGASWCCRAGDQGTARFATRIVVKDAYCLIDWRKGRLSACAVAAALSARGAAADPRGRVAGNHTGGCGGYRSTRKCKPII